MRRKGNHPARAFLKGLCTFLGVILVFLMLMTMGAQAASGQLPRPEALMNLLSQGGESLRQGTSELFHKGEETQSINILLVGQDKREGEQGNRSDSMILCTFNPGAGKLYMTSFLRDLYVPIPGHGRNRINAAYAFGGIKLLQRTLEENFDLEIDGCVEVDFGQFAEIIDALGGWICGRMRRRSSTRRPAAAFRRAPRGSTESRHWPIPESGSWTETGISAAPHGSGKCSSRSG